MLDRPYAEMRAERHDTLVAMLLVEAFGEGVDVEVVEVSPGRLEHWHHRPHDAGERVGSFATFVRNSPGFVVPLRFEPGALHRTGYP